MAAHMRGLSNFAIAASLLLLLLMFAWQLVLTGSAGHWRWLWSVLVVLPAAAVLVSLLRNRPTAPAWTLLGTIPYMTFGVMELVANPLERSWATACAAAACVQFVALVCLKSARARS
jgi:uncharacterized membrane protein